MDLLERSINNTKKIQSAITYIQILQSDLQRGLVSEVDATIKLTKYRMELDVLVKEMRAIQKELDVK